MFFLNLKFYNFRNIKDQEITFSKKNIFFVGKNGQGKSNILEALYILKYGSSYRSLREQIIIKFDNKECSLLSNFTFIDDNNIKVIFKNKKREIFLNNKKVKDRIELLEFNPLIIFNHEDLLLINGSPALKRNFFDQTIALCNIEYIEILRKYKKILKQRNSLLKSGNIDVLDIIDDQLLEYGLLIIKHRIDIVNELNLEFNKLYNSITEENEKIKIEYIQSWENNREVAKDKLLKDREKDLIYKSTNSGPHRDTFIFRNGNIDFGKTASTGQKRLLALIIKLRQSNMVYNKTQKKPILLFDDVLLELDRLKRNNLLKNIGEYEQAFFTFLPEEPYINYYKDNREIYFVNNGGIKKDEKSV